MLSEAFEFLLTPTTKLARKYGFLYSSIALRHRYERCKKIWIPHLKNCQDLFNETVQKVPQKRHVIILGSAHLHEIPIHLLLKDFEQITLVDVVHPLKHHWLAKRNPRVKLVTQDLTEGLQYLESLQSLEDLHQLNDRLAKEEIFKFSGDLIISANLLSQLALLPIEAIERKIKRSLTIEEKDKVCTAFAENHVRNLSRCEGKKLIYADRTVTYKNRNGEIIYQGFYPVDFSGFQFLKKWNWSIAPIGEASKEYSIEMTIEAYAQD